MTRNFQSYHWTITMVLLGGSYTLSCLNPESHFHYFQLMFTDSNILNHINKVYCLNLHDIMIKQ